MRVELSTPAPADEHLWQLACQGQEAAFAQLMQRYASRLVAYGRKWNPDGELVKDAVQDVFTEFWFQRGRHAAIDSVRAYLLASVRNRVGKLSRREQRARQALNEKIGPEFTLAFSVEDDWIVDETQRQRVRRINEAVNRLSPRQQEVIYLKFHQNLSQAQIAEVMGLRYQSVSNLLQRTLTSLRDELSPEFLLVLGLLTCLR